MTDLATLRLVVDANGAIRAVEQFGDAAKRASTRAESLAVSAGRVQAAAALAATAGLALMVKETIEAQRAQAQLAAALRSTGGIAGQTLNALNAQADALRLLTAHTGEAIAQVQALLLTFTQIRGATFGQATQAVLDLATAMGGDLRGAALQVGKALNDPVLGVTALGRAGVQFTAAQKATIAGFVETNQLAKAQAVILRELQTQVGGSAAAYRNTLGGALTALKESFADLFEVGDSPAMASLIENINILADGMGLFAAKSALATAQLQRFLAEQETSARGFLAGGAFFQRVREGIGVSDPEGLTAARQRARQAEIDIEAITALIREIEARVAAGIGGRLGARTGSAGAPGAPDAPALAATGVALSEFDRKVKGLEKSLIATDAQAAKFDRQLKGLAETLKADDAAAQKRDRLLKRGLDESKQALDALTESARVFEEQTQLILGRLFSGLLTDGLRSVDRFLAGIRQAAADALGQLAARRVMDKVGGAEGLLGTVAKLPTELKAIAGATALVVGGLHALQDAFFSSGSKMVEATTKALEAARQLEAARRSFAQNLREFLDYGTPAAQQNAELRRLADWRESLAREAFELYKVVAKLPKADFDALRVAGVETGDAFANVLAFFRLNTGTAAPQAAKDFLAQLEQLQAAFEANAKAAERQVAAERVLALTRSIDTLEGARRDLRSGALGLRNPIQQAEDARAYYEQVLARAKTGDQAAAGQLPDAARAFLERSRAINASSARYVADFQRVDFELSQVQAVLEGERYLQQKIAEGTAAIGEGIIEINEFLTKYGSWIEGDYLDAQTRMVDALAGQLPVLQQSADLLAGQLPVLTRTRDLTALVADSIQAQTSVHVAGYEQLSARLAALEQRSAEATRVARVGFAELAEATAAR